MPESMNHEWELAKLRRQIRDARANGEPVEALEACLSLGESMARQNKPAMSHIERTIPKGDR